MDNLSNYLYLKAQTVRQYISKRMARVMHCQWPHPAQITAILPSIPSVQMVKDKKEKTA